MFISSLYCSFNASVMIHCGNSLSSVYELAFGLQRASANKNSLKGASQDFLSGSPVGPTISLFINTALLPDVFIFFSRRSDFSCLTLFFCNFSSCEYFKVLLCKNSRVFFLASSLSFSLINPFSQRKSIKLLPIFSSLCSSCLSSESHCSD